MPLLHVDEVTKRYDKVLAVDRVSFKAQPGRILGILGPNGAGKTSTIRMITYITIPDSGRITLDGKPVGPWSQRRMGYLPEERGLYRKMKVGEQLSYFGELKGLTRKEALKRSRKWLERFEASDWVNRKTMELSKGQQQKVQFIATILHEPELLILDEPFGGLDPINADLLTDVIMELKSGGRTILFASHRMEQVEQLCDDICMVSGGRIVLDGTLRDVKRQFGKDTLQVDYEGSDAFLEALERDGLVTVSLRSKAHAEMRLLNGASPRAVLERIIGTVDEIFRFELVEPPLRDIFVQVAGKRDEEVAA
ncbi:MAG: ATP-binding cassette domain-containing protein [Rhodothermales bacterium]|nr:ATP-binding cassette domain-containing protein [Rhodothermales bacterium]MBO6778987.1 ATP-binding cassette domain-containing protein [Rhodothermales bacterium]